jgi:hypothetical protein
MIGDDVTVSPHSRGLLVSTLKEELCLKRRQAA